MLLLGKRKRKRKDSMAPSPPHPWLQHILDVWLPHPHRTGRFVRSAAVGGQTCPGFSIPGTLSVLGKSIQLVTLVRGRPVGPGQRI